MSLGRITQVRDIDDNALVLLVSNATYAVDIFFFMSGLLLVYTGWKKLNVTEGRLSVTEFLLHRVWRIWPS